MAALMAVGLHEPRDVKLVMVPRVVVAVPPVVDQSLWLLAGVREVRRVAQLVWDYVVYRGVWLRRTPWLLWALVS